MDVKCSHTIFVAFALVLVMLLLVEMVVCCPSPQLACKFASYCYQMHNSRNTNYSVEHCNNQQCGQIQEWPATLSKDASLLTMRTFEAIDT